MYLESQKDDHILVCVYACDASGNFRRSCSTPLSQDFSPWSQGITNFRMVLCSVFLKSFHKTVSKVCYVGLGRTRSLKNISVLFYSG